MPQDLSGEPCDDAYLPATGTPPRTGSQMSAEQRIPAPTAARPATGHRPPYVPGRSLAVGVIGAGRVGTALAVALHRVGHRVLAVSTTAPDRITGHLPQVAVRPVDR